ncbi:MAG: acetyl/propionyl/methylcrotonyl-CoA carboxylase subunit alpha [Casimicrobiaceae bacterium]
MFDKILIANRGEIACRVAATARRLGISTVAVYSDADADSKHVAVCDEAFRLGPAPARESYLCGDAIVAIAQRCGAGAIHPGYGFLSENEAFAQACSDAGIAFIGPPPSAIAAMGSKSESKRLMGEAGVPLVPGYHGADQDAALLRREADQIRYPVLIKASAGGGGKGMRVVEKGADFAAALASCLREAKASFGDDRVLIEKYLTKPRHVEIQVFADAHGNCVYLFERDCSVQRRHQKVLEEAPAPGMTAERRKAMGEAAVAAARAVGYVGAGTVEFIVDTLDPRPDSFYFMEMNTRLQVEHPVTEMITRLDLVEWQLRVAASEHLPLSQDRLAINGHAIEARIYAEDPFRDFLPSVGRIAHLATPAAISFAFNGDADPAREPAPVRIDSGVREGDAISQFYDPMLAKLIVWGHDRPAALRQMRAALAAYQVAGVTTNIEFLHRLVAHRAFANADLDTGLIARNHAELLPATVIDDDTIVATAIAEVIALQSGAGAHASASPEPHSPWHGIGSWWLNQVNPIDLIMVHDESPHTVSVVTTADGFELTLPRRQVTAQARDTGGAIEICVDGRRFRATVIRSGDERIVFLDGLAIRLKIVDPRIPPPSDDVGEGHLLAPMSGTIIAVNVKPGDKVEKGAALLILEAMKMEHAISAPGNGVVEHVYFRAGDQVKEGAELVALAKA